MIPHEETLDIPVDGQHIAGTLLTPGGSGAAPGVLLVHVWDGSQDQYLPRAREIAALGYVGLTFDLRGHARSEGQRDTVSREDNLRDVIAAYDLLAGHRGVNASAIAIVGGSYGGYLAAILTSLRPVRWLGLRAPALYKDAGWELPKEQLNQDPGLDAYRRRTVPADENRALRACAAFRGDVLLVESEHDHVVPHAVIANYRAACVRVRSLAHHVIEGADHGLSEDAWRQEYTSILVNWLAERTADARGKGASGGDDSHFAGRRSSESNVNKR